MGVEPQAVLKSARLFRCSWSGQSGKNEESTSFWHCFSLWRAGYAQTAVSSTGCTALQAACRNCARLAGVPLRHDLSRKARSARAKDKTNRAVNAKAAMPQWSPTKAPTLVPASTTASTGR